MMSKDAYVFPINWMERFRGTNNFRVCDYYLKVTNNYTFNFNQNNQNQNFIKNVVYNLHA